ncbi:MAG: DUF885 domain-containing protein [Solobacterium sp.]|nr:DUF885 domain-containing protein [Solobacterium sp.]MCI7444947.1 DUF885 domain-containing protein [Solobacterium sp.]MDY5401158.1 DUF885 family protein [Erysipelotrichaceae bacterium]
MKRISKLLSILLVLFILVGCGEDSSPSAENYYLTQLKNYEVREKNSTLDDNKDFDLFLDTIFDELVSDNYLYMHFNVADYKAMGIEKPEVGFGHIVYGVDEEEFNKTEKQLEDLLAFDYDKLSLRQQYDYDLLHYSLLETLCGLEYSKYNLIFSSSSQFSDGIVTNLMEFAMYDEESEEDFLAVLKDVPNYINEAIEYSKQQSNDGLYHSDDMLDEEISYIDNLISSNGKSIYEHYKEYDIYPEVKELVENEVIPAFVTLKEYLNTLYGKTKSDKLALTKINNGYAEYTYITNTSNNGDMYAIYTQLIEVYSDWVNNFINAYQNNEHILEDYEDFLNDDKAINLSAEDMLEYLRNNSSKRYEYLEDANYVVSSLDTLGDSTLGYYVSPPIDNLNQNVIRVNAKINNEEYDQMSVFEVMAHEGFPGHLYQNIYFQQKNPHKFRATQSFIGYTEGYADLAAMDAIDMLNVDDGYKAVAKLNSITFNSHLLLSIVDLGVNYFGWDVNTIGNKLEKLFLDKAIAQPLYDMVVAMPGTFVRYGVGYVSHLNLRKKAMDELGDKFDFVAYDMAIIENGPLPFAILEGVVEDYINENK